MPVYRIEYELVATAYVRADNQEKAVELAKKYELSEIDVYSEDISDMPLDDDDLPEFSFSPDMKINTFDPDTIEEVD